MAPDHAYEASSHRRRLGRYATLAVTSLAGLAIGLGSLELFVRIAKPSPRRQIIRGFGLRALDGAPLWEVATDRQNRICPERHPERTNILFLGSSITFGTDLDASAVFTHGLEARLNQLRPLPGFCVLNFAQPAFSFQQKYAVARTEIPRYRPALILWENWVEWNEYALIGQAAYSIRDLRLRPDGFVGMAHVPDPLNRALFLRSRLYEYVTLSWGERSPRLGPHGHPLGDQEEVSEFAREKLIQLLQLARTAGSELVFYLAPPLDRPFSESTASPPGWQRAIMEFAAAQSISAYPLQRELADQDFRELRMDPCCHYNARGHDALATVMERIVIEKLGGGRFDRAGFRFMGRSRSSILHRCTWATPTTSRCGRSR
jgi:hypothetical protein